ncbi:P-loop containing nucleoside triphosphate hydrolase protein [Aspergillus sclerotioniger CBS 115572]|uniref:P-loop containing nucleoside triphosphate hydrolase protein n=1 Tax=Aspergillus sclerotioniger CBS 115572 TaxID=1450535 RepID=A0A317X8F3_9EURO|nr:P-loop containing nucleoside triphosphate hydrolase protein [Aspergillus sclerotioniger CBS 115572]PWY93867.1 P-loop containing nucleoside triphosphate hydrolase protein [Aspergillus sclerotioniger CBS 115572]
MADATSADYAPAGSICQACHLYETSPDKSSRTSWTKTPPTDLVGPAENSESGQYALLVRNVKCYSGRKNLEIHSIVVQSGHLKRVLADVMRGYPRLTMELERVEFASPFEPFVHRWKKFTKARDTESDEAVKAHIDLLYNILEGELHDVISRKNDLVRNGVMTYDSLWTIFEPHQAVFSIVNGRRRIFKMESSEVDPFSRTFVIAATYVDFDGTKFGHMPHHLFIPYYEGTKPIMSLSVFPLVYHGDQALIRKDLISRGKLWSEYKGHHYKQYEGLALTKGTNGYNVKSRIIIDAEAYKTFNPSDSLAVSGNISDKLTDNHLLIAAPVLRGYSLKDKRWLEFFIDGVSDIVWNARAFDSLVLPHGHHDLKELILAFAQTQSSNLDVFDDVIQGKGRGVVMLLSGSPGVGKTLTAESVAEVMQVPLYVLSAGDLGTSASRVEENMKPVLRMVPKWGAILLLDEADVFMQARDQSDLQRNELVCVFLRLLEYYEGILFLTSNRAETIDRAFESRIHISLRYPDLNANSRRQIWIQLLGDSVKLRFSEQQLDELAGHNLNGRQIKNVLKTASLLARRQEMVLCHGHIQTVLRVRAAHS